MGIFLGEAPTRLPGGQRVYGRTHEPTFYAINLAGFSGGTAAKSWLATGVFVLVMVQLASAPLPLPGPELLRDATAALAPLAGLGTPLYG